ncbi:glycoside hydrolase family 88 protein [Aridibaculum aurantiacum]|uniref:glycoside hydrolase family 88 protein n=1 Tax=Aridibaculum aurantiacum TaxID=2810307 RepID=UPI001A968D5E|nr:glycoside hydrolase family 88 protein [Aridibaculum aurantiacum]
MKKLLIGIVALLVVQLAEAQQPVSQQLASTVMKLWADSFALVQDKPAKWSYDQGVFLKGIEGIWKRTGDPLYYNYIQKSMDFYVDNSGKIKGYQPDEYNIDHVNNGKILLLLYRVTGKEKYWRAATQLRDQLRSHPRTTEGGFWHKKIYTNQMWLDGLYMGQPFYAEYALLAKDDTAFNEIARQFILMEKHARDAKTGLLYHGWDESKEQQWANKETGVSPNFWGRAMGWYAMALVDVLDHFPANHPQRKDLVNILNRLTVAVTKVQDPKNGLWYQVLDKGGQKGNYVEASASAMFTYAIAKGVRKGYLDQKHMAVANKAWQGMLKQFIKKDASGNTILAGTVSVSGLGGKPYRDGSYEYYLSEKVIDNDPKGMGAFLKAANEMEVQPQLNIGRGKTVLLDNYFNNEFRKDAVVGERSYHYTWDDMSNSGFSLMGDLFQYNGAKTATLKEAPTRQNLAQANVFIIIDPDTEKETAKPNYMDEQSATAIAEWVKAGGVLAVFTNDAGNSDLDKINILTQKFGIRFNNDGRNMVKNNVYEQGAITIPANNPIFKTAKKVFLKEISTLDLSAPAQAIVKEGGDNIIAVAKYGKGAVFAVGDPWLYNEYIDGRKIPLEYQNHKAAQDLVKWLLQQPANAKAK